jgi:hypothetical protein
MMQQQLLHYLVHLYLQLIPSHYEQLRFQLLTADLVVGAALVGTTLLFFLYDSWMMQHPLLPSMVGL